MASFAKFRWKACERKMRFVTVKEAKRALERTVWQTGDDGTLAVYHCRFCGGFHLGHPSRASNTSVGVLQLFKAAEGMRAA